jgi:hypothetical protein
MREEEKRKIELEFEGGSAADPFAGFIDSVINSHIDWNDDGRL